MPGCLLGISSCNLPRCPCANIIFIIQTGKLPKPHLNPKLVCLNAQSFVRMRQEDGPERQVNGEQAGNQQEMEGEGCRRNRTRRGNSENSGRTWRRGGVQRANSDLWATQIGPRQIHPRLRQPCGPPCVSSAPCAHCPHINPDSWTPTHPYSASSGEPRAWLAAGPG